MKYYEPLQYTVGPEEDGWRLDTVLRKKCGLSRRLVTRLKKTEKGIMVNGERAWTSRKVKAGDRIALHMEVEQSEQIKPEAIPLTILYEDEHLLVLNKQAGLVVHPTHGHYEGTIANGVVHHWQRSGQSYRFRPIHRLDADTSGVLVVAKNPFAHQQVYEQMLAGRVEKQYLALVHGRPPSAKETIRAAIRRDRLHSHLRMVASDGATAITKYELVETYAGASLLRLQLVTGRTHQIRVHLLHLGCPLIGDALYATPASRVQDAALGMQRQALHAVRIAFTHPVTAEPLAFHAPLPADLAGLRRRLRKMD